MSEQPKPNCKVIRLGAVGALLECIAGRDDQAAELLAMLNGDELQAVENGAVALSLHASRARGGGEAPAEGWRAAYDKLAAEAVALRERAREAEERTRRLRVDFDVSNEAVRVTERERDTARGALDAAAIVIASLEEQRDEAFAKLNEPKETP